ncbi:hypothetical protein M9458_013525, partial [Cirrhinus mrigala]
FSGDRANISFIISLLSRKARQWAEFLSGESPVIQTLDSFVTHFRQAERTVHEYTIHFRTLAASSGRNEIALLSAYQRGLNPKLRQQMAIYDDSVGLESFMQKAQLVSQHLFAVSLKEEIPSGASPSSSSSAPEPMQTDQYHLSTDERQCHVQSCTCTVEKMIIFFKPAQSVLHTQ